MGEICTRITLAAALLAVLVATAAEPSSAEPFAVTKRGASGQVYVWQTGSC